MRQEPKKSLALAATTGFEASAKALITTNIDLSKKLSMVVLQPAFQLFKKFRF